MRGEDKREQRYDAETNDKTSMVKFNLQSNLMFGGKGKVGRTQTYQSIVLAKLPIRPKKWIKPPEDGKRYQEKARKQ